MLINLFIENKILLTFSYTQALWLPRGLPIWVSRKSSSVSCLSKEGNHNDGPASLCGLANLFTSIPKRLFRSRVYDVDSACVLTVKKFVYESQVRKKCTSGHVRQTEIQISLRIRAVWSESPLGNFVWIAKDINILHADNEDSDQTARMRRPIWALLCVHVSEGRFSHVQLILFSCLKQDIVSR